MHFKLGELDCSVEFPHRWPHQSHIKLMKIHCFNTPLLSTIWPALGCNLLVSALVPVLPRRTLGRSKHVWHQKVDSWRTDRRGGGMGLRGVSCWESTDLFLCQNRLAQAVIHTNIYYLALYYHQHLPTDERHAFDWIKVFCILNV